MLLPTRGDSERSWTVERAEIEARNSDLKAVNPNAVQHEDTRTPAELLDAIETHGRDAAEALAALRRLTSGEVRFRAVETDTERNSIVCGFSKVVLHVGR